MLYIVIISLLGCAAVYLVVETVLYNIDRIKLTRIKTARFKDRAPRNCAEIYDNYFIDADITYDEFQTIWRDIGIALFVDPAYLRPEDSLNDPRITDNTQSISLHGINSACDLKEIICIHTMVGRGLEKPLVEPNTIRDAVYLCLGRSLPEVPNHPKV